MIHRYIPPFDDDGYGYWRSLAALWTSPDVIVNVEHDMEFSPTLVDKLLSCPHPLCSHAYQMYVPRNYYAHSHNADGIGGYWVSAGEEWAEYSAIGFCKIAPEARVRPLERGVWRLVEFQVNRAVDGIFHLHWPEIEHFHKR